MLKVENLHVYYGSIHAIKGVSFEVHEREIVTLIGANGAGKSTTLNTVAGLLHPRSGGLRSCARWRRIRPCCCWTSRRRA